MVIMPSTYAAIRRWEVEKSGKYEDSDNTAKHKTTKNYFGIHRFRSLISRTYRQIYNNNDYPSGDQFGLMALFSNFSLNFLALEVFLRQELEEYF